MLQSIRIFELKVAKFYIFILLYFEREKSYFGLTTSKDQNE